MTINFKTNVRTVIRYKGQEYSSLDQLPPEGRAMYDAALAKGVMAKAAAGHEQIVVNGHSFASPSEMPAPERKLYDDAISLVRETTTIPSAPVASSSWLTPSQLRFAVALAAVVVLVVWLVELFH